MVGHANPHSDARGLCGTSANCPASVYSPSTPPLPVYYTYPPVNNTLRLQLCSFPSCLELGSQALYKRAKLQNCTLLHLIKSTLHMCRRSPGILNCCCGLNSLCDRIVVKVELLKVFAALSLSFIFNIQPCLIFSQLQLISSRHRVRESYGRFDCCL